MTIKSSQELEKKLKIVREFAKNIMLNGDLKVTLQELVRVAIQFTNMPLGIVTLISNNRYSSNRIIDTYQYPDEPNLTKHLLQNEKFYEHLVTTGKIYSTSDIATDPFFLDPDLEFLDFDSL
ncbi:MAG: hypothetical protein AAF846_22120, partial [Chloroflexota bacterium]